MPIVNIPNVGSVSFPDTMSHEDITKAIETDILKKPQPEVTLPQKEGFGEAASAEFINRATALSRYLGGATEETHKKTLENQEQIKQPDNWYSPEAWGSVVGAAGVTLPAMGMMAPVAAAALPAGAGGLTTAAVTGLAGSALTSPAEGLNTYQQAINHGVDAETAQRAAISAGVIDAAGNALPGQGGLFGRMIKGAGQNIGANVASGYAHNAIMGDEYAKEHRDPWDSKSMMLSGVMGASLGAVTGSKQHERWLSKNETPTATVNANERLNTGTGGKMSDVESKLLVEHYTRLNKAIKSAQEEVDFYTKFIKENGDASTDVVNGLVEAEARLKSAQEEVSKLDAIFADERQTTPQQRTDIAALREIANRPKPYDGPPRPQREVSYTEKSADYVDESIAQSDKLSDPVNLQPKTTPVEIALQKIGQATGDVALATKNLAEIRERMANMEQRSGQVPGAEYNSKLEAMRAEEKAYLDIISGKQPDLSWFDNAPVTHTEAPRIDSNEATGGVPLTLEDHAAIDAGLQRPNLTEQPVAGIEHTQEQIPLSAYDAESGKPSYEPNVPDYGDTPTVSAKQQVQKLKFQKQGLEQKLETVNKALQNYNEGKTPSGTTDVAGLETTRKNLESFIEHVEKQIEQTIRSNPKLLKQTDVALSKEGTAARESLVITPVQYKTIDEALAAGQDDLAHVLQTNPQLFKNPEGTQTFFDKSMPAIQQKVITHFVKILGMQNEKMFFVNASDINSYGRISMFGNTSIIRLQKGKIDSRVAAVNKGSPRWSNMLGAAVDASEMFYHVRVAAHEVGHLLLTRYVRDMTVASSKVRIPFDELPLVKKLQEQFNQLTKEDFTSVVPYDLTKSNTVEARQAHFHEFFAEQVAKELLYKHTLGAFVTGKGKWTDRFNQLIQASFVMLRKHNVDVDKKNFARELVNDVITQNKESMDAAGKTIWENFQLKNMDKQVFSGMSLGDVNEAIGKYTDWHQPMAPNSVDFNLDPAKRFSVGAITKLVSKIFPKNQLEAIFKDNPHVGKAYQYIREAERHAVTLSKKIWFGAESQTDFNSKSVFTRFSDVKNGNSPYHTVKKMTNDVSAKLHDIFKKGFEEDLDYSESLQKYGAHLSQNERETFESLAKMFQQQYHGIVDLQNQLGKKHILEFRKGWYPSERMGDWSVSIKYGDGLTHRQHFATETAAKAFFDKTQKEKFQHLTVMLPEKKDLDALMDLHDYEATEVDAILSTIKQKYPKASPQMLRELEAMSKLRAERGGKLGMHHEERANITGYKGSELYGSPEELGKSFKEAIIKSVDGYAGGVRKLYLQTKIRPMLADSRISEDSKVLVQQMYDSTLSRVPNTFEKFDSTIREFTEKVSKVAHDVLGVEYKGKNAALDKLVNNSMELLYLYKIIAKGAFIIGQPLSSLQVLRQMSYQGGYLKPWYSYGKGLTKMIMGNKELNEAMLKSKNESNTFEPQFIDSLHLTEDTGPIVTAIKDWGMLRRPAEVADSMSRAISYAALFTHYRDLGYSFDRSVKLAEHGTDASMVVYGNRDSAPIFNHMGFTGTMIRPLQTYPTAALGNLVADVKNMSMRDYKSFAPFVNYTLSTIILSGVMGLQLITEYEMLRKMMEDKDPGSGPPAVIDIMKTDSEFQERVQADPEAWQMALILGVPSAVTGVDVASSLRANETLATTVAGVLGGQKAVTELLPLTALATDVGGGFATLAKDKWNRTVGNEGKDLSVMEKNKAIGAAGPSGAFSYGLKELAGVNESKILGESTGMKAAGKEGEASTERTTTDKVAGYLGTKSTEDRMNLMVNMRKQELDKRRTEHIKKNANLFAETGNPVYLERLQKLDVSDKQLENTISNSMYKKLVDQRIRYMANKQGKINEQKAMRAVEYGDMPE